MFRLVCPCCHTPLRLSDLEPSVSGATQGFVCPECSAQLITGSEAAQRVEEVTAHA